jgi:hypothetical protein
MACSILEAQLRTGIGMPNIQEMMDGPGRASNLISDAYVADLSTPLTCIQL